MRRTKGRFIGVASVLLVLFSALIRPVSAQTPAMPNCRHFAADMNVIAAEWSPDAKQIAFSTRSERDNANSQSKLWLVNADGTNLNLLWLVDKPNHYIYGIKWSPDGKKLGLYVPKIDSMVTEIGGTDYSDRVYIFDVQTKTSPTLYYSGFAGPENPQAFMEWSPNSRYIALSSWNGFKLALINIDTIRPPDTASSVILEDKFYAPAEWSADSRYFTFAILSPLQLITLSVEGNYEFANDGLHAVKGEPPLMGAILNKKAGDRPNGLRGPRWGGSYIAFSGERTLESTNGQLVGQRGLFIFRLSGEDAAYFEVAGEPVWFPDGHHILFTQEDAVSHIFQFYITDIDQPHNVLQITYGDQLNYSSLFASLSNHMFGFISRDRGIYVVNTDVPCIIDYTR